MFTNINKEYFEVLMNLAVYLMECLIVYILDFNYLASSPILKKNNKKQLLLLLYFLIFSLEKSLTFLSHKT